MGVLGIVALAASTSEKSSFIAPSISKVHVLWTLSFCFFVALALLFCNWLEAGQLHLMHDKERENKDKKHLLPVCVDTQK